MENNKVPTLRFPSFKGDWNKSIIKNIANKITDGTHDTPKPTKSGIPFLTAIHVRDGFIDFENCYYLPEDVHNKIYARCNPEKDDLLMVNIGAGVATSAKVNVDYEFSLKNVALIKPNHIKIDPDFFSQIQRRNSARLRHQISTGGAQPFLSLKEIGKLKLVIPKEKTEQTRIATFLTTVDQRINLLEKKKTHLEQYKKGVMQKLFPPKGEQTPEIRFKKDDGTDYPAWEEKKIKELFSFKQGVQCGIEKQSLIKNDGQIRFIRIVDLTKNDEPIRYIDDPGKEHRIYNNDLFMVRYGNAGLIGYNYQGVIANNLFKILPINENLIDNQFYFFVFTIMQRKLEALASSSTMPALNFKSLEGLKLPFPTKKEQQKIAAFLSAIDKKIERTQEQIVGMQEWKKGLLQKMFV